jgi:CRP-like cAMP-binding protein
MELIMADDEITRKQRFRAALAAAGLTAGQWAESAGYSQEHLSRVLNERLDSDALCVLIDAFIAEQMSKLTAQVA